MDANLSKQFLSFKAHAAKMPTVEQRSRPPDRKNSKKLSKPTNSPAPSFKPPTTSSLSAFAPQPNKHKFALLTQIVNHMRGRHQKDFSHPLTLDELLEESRLHDSATSLQKHWLLNEALRNNSKIEVIEDGSGTVKFLFKPTYKIKDKRDLLRLLDQQDQRGLGGILVDDIIEGLPKAKKRLKAIKSKIIFVTGADKKEVAFLNDQSCDFKVDEEFQKLWRSVPVESMEENKIEEYLNNNGLASIQDKVAVKPAALKRKKASNRKRKFKTHNDHLTDVLEDYSDGKK